MTLNMNHAEMKSAIDTGVYKRRVVEVVDAGVVEEIDPSPPIRIGSVVSTRRGRDARRENAALVVTHGWTCHKQETHKAARAARRRARLQEQEKRLLSGVRGLIRFVSLARRYSTSWSRLEEFKAGRLEGSLVASASPDLHTSPDKPIECAATSDSVEEYVTKLLGY